MKIEPSYTNSHLSSDERTALRSAQLVTELNEVVRQLKTKQQALELRIHELVPKADMYDKIVKMVMEHEQLQSIWDDLIVTMKMLDIKDLK